ncbi:NAD(P)/FAD-dependent oxidoreductase [Paenibacillus sp. MMS18-CY102]|uniref:NAD(P)/FAD-dependent oxidoreductase n=1 Tax=Paenibacillus sp. MMS18-CY102 TaxID=2682849 RepID=UPI001366335F|nr:NAD(P)/FAD-dependent oxidoreductase [Paenibacillus sp. MMS18-CY102]MWC30714.1 NAD(P)/FAD-dependent oxidoreductase [Paenibacillus sp. MMS18-CY102]
MHDAIIIGAGVAGASMACALAGQGWDTLLLDRHAFPRHKVCGAFLSPESRQSLTELGLDAVLGELQPAPIPIGEIRIAAAQGAPLKLTLPIPAQSVSRYALDLALQTEAHARGAQVRTGSTVTAISQTLGGWQVTVRSRDQGSYTLEARAVIGAWGRTAPAGLSNQAVERSKLFMGLRTELSGVPAEAAVELYFFPGGYVGLVPSGNEAGLANAAALVTPEAFRRCGQSAAGVIAEAARVVPALNKRLLGAEPVVGTAAAAPVELDRRPLAWGIVPHIGDAAAVIPPLCGDGMAMGLHAVTVCAPMVDRYLRGTLTVGGWRAAYNVALTRDFAGPLWWGGLLQAGLGIRGLSPVLLRLGRAMPSLAYRFVEATRLRAR